MGMGAVKVEQKVSDRILKGDQAARKLFTWFFFVFQIQNYQMQSWDSFSLWLFSSSLNSSIRIYLQNGFVNVRLLDNMHLYRFCNFFLSAINRLFLFFCICLKKNTYGCCVKQSCYLKEIKQVTVDEIKGKLEVDRERAEKIEKNDKQFYYRTMNFEKRQHKKIVFLHKFVVVPFK